MQTYIGWIASSIALLMFFFSFCDLLIRAGNKQTLIQVESHLQPLNKIFSYILCYFYLNPLSVLSDILSYRLVLLHSRSHTFSFSWNINITEFGKVCCRVPCWHLSHGHIPPTWAHTLYYYAKSQRGRKILTHPILSIQTCQLERHFPPLSVFIVSFLFLEALDFWEKGVSLIGTP